MSKRFLGFGDRFLSQPNFIGRGRAVPTPITLDPADYEGAALYAADGQFYYSDGVRWRIPQDTVDIARPAALPPTDSDQARRLRLSPFFSPRGLTQTGVFFEVATSQDGFDSPLFARSITSTSVSEYVTIYPGDGLAPGQAFWWRGLYTGTEGSQSEFSVPFRQVYPELIDNPRAVTPEGATTGVVELTPFNSNFGLSYVETQIELWEAGADPAVDDPVETVTAVTGAAVALPDTLVEGAGYIWRGRYGGRVGGTGPITYTDWTVPRTVLNGAASMILVYDPALALNRTVFLPLGVYGGIVNVEVDWGDGETEAFTTAGIKSHVYAAGVTGPVTVTISGQLQQYGGNANIQGLIRVDNIGFQLGLTSLREMFRNCTTNTTYVNPALPPQVTSLEGAFRSADPGFEVQSLGVGNVRDFTDCFLSAVDFNQPLAAWDMSSAEIVRGMFLNAISFNQPLAGWNMSSVRDASYMFAVDASVSVSPVFNQPLANWDTSRFEDISFMFSHSSGSGNPSSRPIFNQPIGAWDVSSVTNFRAAFKWCSFNQPLAAWDVSSGQDFREMFAGSSYNQSLAGWDISSASSVDQMFALSPFNNDVSGWSLPSDIEGLFDTAAVFNHPSIAGWNTSGVTVMARLFRNASVFNQNISPWNVGAVTNFTEMFYSSGGDALIFNQPIGSWNVSSAQLMTGMFRMEGATSGSTLEQGFDQDISGWNVASVQSFDLMFAVGPSARRVHAFDQDISGWPLRQAGVSMLDMFRRSNTGIGTLSSGLSQENYSRILTGWANRVANQNGPFSVSLGVNGRTYSATDYASGETYEDAVAGRAYLTNSNRLTVASAGDADADGDYLFDGTVQLYVNANDWYFVKTSAVWELRDSTDTVQATQQDAGDLSAPQLVETWDGDLASATVARTGAAWTITDGGLAA
jgi:hypothetical protein